MQCPMLTGMSYSYDFRGRKRHADECLGNDEPKHSFPLTKVVADKITNKNVASDKNYTNVVTDRSVVDNGRVDAVYVNGALTRIQQRNIENIINESALTYGMIMQKITTHDKSGNIAPNGQRVLPNGGVCIHGGSLLNDLTRDDLKELYRLMMLKYGDNRPEEEFERVLWGDLKTMFDPPSEEDAIWKLPHQQQILNWRYFHSCSVHCLTVEAAHIYMLTEVKYPLPPRVCKAMLEKKLLGDRKDESTMSNRHKDWLVQEQTALGKDFSNPFMADNLPKIEAHNEDIQRNLKFTSEDQVRGGLLGIIVNRLKSGSYRVKSGRHMMMKHHTMKMHQTMAMDMEHYLEYIDNDVWKVIQNGNSKNRISTGKEGVVRILPPVSAAEIHAVEKERKARTILLMAIPKEHLRRFHGMDDAK
ncbi:hypothetical protein Tco_0935584 [Tanacetum coccineum]